MISPRMKLLNFEEADEWASGDLIMSPLVNEGGLRSLPDISSGSSFGTLPPTNINELVVLDVLNFPYESPNMMEAEIYSDAFFSNIPVPTPLQSSNSSIFDTPLPVTPDCSVAFADFDANSRTYLGSMICPPNQETQSSPFREDQSFYDLASNTPFESNPSAISIPPPFISDHSSVLYSTPAFPAPPTARNDRQLNPTSLSTWLPKKCEGVPSPTQLTLSVEPNVCHAQDLHSPFLARAPLAPPHSISNSPPNFNFPSIASSSPDIHESPSHIAYNQSHLPSQDAKSQQSGFDSVKEEISSNDNSTPLAFSSSPSNFLSPLAFVPLPIQPRELRKNVFVCGMCNGSRSSRRSDIVRRHWHALKCEKHPLYGQERFCGVHQCETCHQRFSRKDERNQHSLRCTANSKRVSEDPTDSGDWISPNSRQ